ncbi:MAG: sulfatase-like hydrolase/transferase, partial [Verrucomicrobiota bacterium]|nr:sulfatase-like hydrolase/transferase [Verrucomicrobiota bacterium]
MRIALGLQIMKRTYRVGYFLIMAIFFFCDSLNLVHSKPEAVRPNVLFIAIDDLNDWVGCLKTNSQARTPNIDRLASRGVLFTNAHCQAPICNPSRTSLMLGLRPSTTGIYINRPWFRNSPKNKNRITLTQYFGTFGYETLTTGKIFHGSKVDDLSFKKYGPRPGQMSGLDNRVQENVPSPTKLWDFGPQNYTEEEHSDYKDASWAIDQLKKEFTKPFFLAVGFYRPHVPLFAPAKYFKSRPIS